MRLNRQRWEMVRLEKVKGIRGLNSLEASRMRDDASDLQTKEGACSEEMTTRQVLFSDCLEATESVITEITTVVDILGTKNSRDIFRTPQGHSIHLPAISGNGSCDALMMRSQGVSQGLVTMS